jgi:hypothetical protein
VLVYGQNLDEIRWPLQTFSWVEYCKQLLYCLQTGEMPPALPVYGELARLMAESRPVAS